MKEKQDFALSIPPTSTLASQTSKEMAQTRFSKVKSYLNETIGDDIYLEIELLFLAFGIGIQDATTFPDYLCFASNQTGNTVFLAIETAKIGAENFPFSNIGFSLAVSITTTQPVLTLNPNNPLLSPQPAPQLTSKTQFFILGSLTMGQLGHYHGPTRRLWILLTNTLQTLLIMTATTIQYSTPLLPTGPMAWTVIATLAFSSGAQVAMARGLGITEITTAMATAAYVDLVADPKLLKRENRGRNRRVAFLVSLTAGAFVGAFPCKMVGGAFGLLLSCGIKVGVSIAMMFNRKVGGRGFV